MSKLDTYVKIKDFTEIGTLVKANLYRSHRSLVARLLCGILPLEVETGRFAHNKVEREFRYCKLCGNISAKMKKGKNEGEREKTENADIDDDDDSVEDRVEGDMPEGDVVAEDESGNKESMEEKKEVEDEMHFMFTCKRLKDVRKKKLDPVLKSAPEVQGYNNFEKMMWLLEKDRIVETGEIIAALYQRRQDVLYRNKG